MRSLKELYRIGKGPSSSHTIAPERACCLFLSEYPNATSFKVVLFGSLANGAVVKNMKLLDVGYGNGAYAAVLASSIWAATIENVTIDVTYTSNSSSATTTTHHVGYLAHMTSEGATYRNLTVTVKSSTFELVSLFGGCGWRGYKNTTFENCVINAKLGAIGHKGEEVYSCEGVSGLTVNDPTV